MRKRRIQCECDKACKVREMLAWNYSQGIGNIFGFIAKDVTFEISGVGSTWSTLDGVPEQSQPAAR